MKKKTSRRNAELNRLYDTLKKLEPGTDEYNRVLEEAIKLDNASSEIEQAKVNKLDLAIKVGGIVATTIVFPLVKYGLNRKMVRHIGTIEQMETFVSSAGKRMIPEMYERF